MFIYIYIFFKKKKVFKLNFFPSLVSDEILQKVNDVIAVINTYQNRLQDIKKNYLTYVDNLNNKLQYINNVLCLKH